MFVVRQTVVRYAGHGFGEIGSEDFGVKVLTDRLGELAGKLFDIKTMLEDFERFPPTKLRTGLNVPTGIVQTGNILGRKGVRIGERGGKDFDRAIGQTSVASRL